MKDYNIHGNNWIMDRLWYTDRYLLFYVICSTLKMRNERGKRNICLKQAGKNY